MHNVATLLMEQGRTRPATRFGVAPRPRELGVMVASADALARELLTDGCRPGRPAALIGGNSDDWLVTWMACQLAGIPVALVNPAFPDTLVTQVLRPLGVQAMLTTDAREPIAEFGTRWRSTRGAAGRAGVEPSDAAGLPGLTADDHTLSGYMLTSGTSGPPKLVAQSHRYFLRLGRYVADVLALTPVDTVLTPLPLFHINPLGYAVLGALTSGAGCVSVERFSASGFWPTVREFGVTAAVLHGPPVEILKRRTTRDDAAPHRLRTVLYADPEFLKAFDIPTGVSVYGSTEGAGLSHTHVWRPSDADLPPEGAAQYGGALRLGFRQRLQDGEILIAADEPGLLAQGYVSENGQIRSFLQDGWYHSGDLGYHDRLGGLVYVTRAAESIRVKGEFVPVKFVEDAFGALDGVSDLAVWKRPSELLDDELVLYLSGPTEIPVAQVKEISKDLPGFMRPVAVALMRELPRDTGVGKVRRRELSTDGALEVIEL